MYFLIYEYNIPRKVDISKVEFLICGHPKSMNPFMWTSKRYNISYRMDRSQVQKPYVADSAYYVDMFSWTGHVETVVLMCASSEAGKC